MKNKTTWIIVGIVLAVIILIVGIFAGANNKAIFLEEQINGAQANINVAEKRRVDLVYNLVDAVQAYQDYEGKTLEAITAARSSVSNGDIDEAKVSINAVAEAYPELKANENYQQLMNELAMTENQIAQYRNNYNEQVRAYNKMIRSFPNNVILSILGYERIETMHRRISLIMVIKKRELLFSVIIVCVLLCLGLFISGKISYGAAQTAEKYATATIIEDHSQFRYGMNTDFGNVLLYGELSTDSPVTFDEIGNGYIYIEKVREDYTRHTRTVTKKDSNGNTYTETEVYYSWDYVSSEHLATDTIVFLGEPFSYGTISLPVRRLNLADAGVEKQRWNYIYKNSDTRYYYNVTDVSLVGTVFATLSDGTIKNASSLYENDTPVEVIESVQQSETLYLIFFWLAWVVFMAGCVYGFLYLENRWLD